MKDRIRAVRKALNMNMRDFGKEVGLTHSAISLIERGERNPTVRLIKMICDNFHVNRKWLETGEGEMFEKDPTVEIAAMAKYMLRTENSDLKKQFLQIVYRLSPEQLQTVADIAQQIAEAQERGEVLDEDE